MTAKFLNNYPARNAVRIISQNRKFAIVISVLSLLGIPLAMGAVMISGYLESLDNKRNTDMYYGFESGPYIAIGAFCAGIAVFMGMFCAIRAFEEEWNKTRVDMLYALPLNGTQRFFSNYLGGFAMYAVPYIVSVLIGWIIMLIMLPLISSNFETWQAEELNEFYLYYFLGSLGLFVLMCMYYTIAAVCASCCGTLFENIYTNLLLNTLIPGTFAAVIAVVTDAVNGLDFDYSWEFIGYTSPIGGLIYLCYILIEKGIDTMDFSDYSDGYAGYGGSAETSGLIPAYLRWIVVILLLTAGLLVLAWKLYQHRKAEHVGKPFIYIWIYYVIITAVTVCILCISAAEDDAIFAVILFSAIVYFIMEVIRKRGFKKFWVSIVTYIVTVAVAIGGFFLTVSTECFGRTKYIPALATVTSAEISFNEHNGRSAYYRLTYKDKDTIQKIQEFHKNYFKNHDTLEKNLNALCKEYHYNLIYEGYDSYTDTYSEQDYTKFYTDDEDDEDIYYNCFYTTDLTINYHTIAGITIHRSYSVYPDEYFDLLKICIGTEPYTQANGNLMRNRLLNKIKKYSDKTHQYEYPFNASFTVEYFSNDSENSSQKIYISDSENTIRTFADIYQTDMQSLTFENFCKDRILGYIENMPVYESCTGTVAFLKDHGFTEFDFSQMLADSVRNSSAYQNLLSIRIYAPEEYKTGSLNYPFSLTGTNDNVIFKQTENAAYQDTLWFPDGVDMQTYCNALSQAVSQAREHYISTEPCYLLVVNGRNYLIPPESAEAVQKFIKHGSYYYRDGQIINTF